MNIVDDLIKIVGSENVCQNEPMSKHTTFRIGGNADFFVTPNTTESLEAVINYVKSNNIPYYVIGNGSNLLVKDSGFRGVIIQLYKKFANITVNDNVITAQAGALLSTVAKTALQFSYRYGVLKWYSWYYRWCCVYECRCLWWRNEGYCC